MIEFPITLTSGGSVCLPGHAFALALGYTKNRGVYRLHVDATGEWEGLAIRCFWHVPDGKAPASSLVVDGYVDVPASVTAQPGNGCITFEGSDGTMTVTSADLRYDCGCKGTQNFDICKHFTNIFLNFFTSTLIISHLRYKKNKNTKKREHFMYFLNIICILVV